MQEFSDIKLMRGVRMNLDTSAELAQPNEAGEIWNMIEQNGEGKLTNIKGFESVMDMAVNASFTMPSGTNTCVGTTTDIENSTIIYFIHNNLGSHGIMQMNTETHALTWILKDEPLLNFKTTSPIEADVIEGLLYWTDGYFSSFLNNDFNPPRKVNINKAKAYTAAYNSADRWTYYMVAEAASLTGNPDYTGYTAYVGSGAYVHTVGTNVVAWALDGINRYKNSTGYGTVLDQYVDAGTYVLVTDRPWQETAIVEKQIAGHMLTYATDMYFGIDWQVMDRVKYQPVFAPTASYDNDTTRRSNNLRKHLFQFAYRHVYDDNEKTTWSPVSDVPLPSTIEQLNGGFDVDPTVDNVINVWFDTGPLEVKSVEIAVREGNNGSWGIIDRKYKYNESGEMILTSDVYNYTSFYNTEIGEPLDQEDINRLYDAVPQVSAHQEVIEKNRLLDADYWQDYDNIDIDSQFSVQSQSVTTGDIEYYGGTIQLKAAYPEFGVSEKLGYQAFRMDLNGFYETGYTYFITVDAYPYQYIGKSANDNDVWFEFYGKTVRSIAVVTVPTGMTIQTFLNKVCAQLRSGSTGSAVVGINHYDYDVLGDYSGFRDEDSGGGNQYCNLTTLGVIVGYYIQDGTTGALTATNISILKVKNSTFHKTWKSGETKMCGFEYVDRAGRTSMIMRSSGTSVYVPALTEFGGGQDIKQNFLKYSINHQPPDWAEYYRIVFAKGKSSSFYLQASISQIEDADSLDCLKFDVNQYIMYQNDVDRTFTIGKYEWQQGDRVRFIMNRTSTGEWKSIDGDLDFDILGVYTPTTDDIYQTDNKGDYITDANGNKIIETRKQSLLVQNFEYADYDIAPNKTVIEIYRPSKLGENDVYYQRSQTIRILNPHTEERLHDGDTPQVVGLAPATGLLTSGDAYIYNRLMYNAFPVESSSFSDRYKSDVIDIGRVNAIDRNVRRTRFISRVLFSGKLIQNTRVNDLSKVSATDSTELADKYGSINHIEEVGDTLKILQKSKPSSLYIGRAGVTQPSAEATDILSSTKDVLGTLIVHKSDYGTVHSGSVLKNESRHYWFDFYAHAICRDPGNGIQNLSDGFGLSRFLQAKCKAFGTADNVTVTSAWDQANEVAWFTFNDKTTPANSFTVGFRDTGGRTQDGFVLFTHALPDCYGASKQTLTSFKDGKLWLHYSDNVSRCNFYGTQYKYWVTPIFNKAADTVKRMLQLVVSTNKPVSCPNAGDIYILPNDNQPQGMTSLLKAGAFTPVQGKYVADIGRNMTTHQSTPSLYDLVDGDDMEGQAMTVRIEGEQTTEHKIFTAEVRGVTT